MRLIHGDCLDALRNLPDNSVDAVVTDPPAGIAFMGKHWDGDKGGRDQWIAWLAERLTECLRVLKPGGHAVVWALPRTSGWTHRALEDAGFDVRDCVHHLFGSGFPKSANVSKLIDKAAGAEREVVGRYRSPENTSGALGSSHFGAGERESGLSLITAPATAEAQQWDGWGTALKPAVEHWWLARKPLDSTVAGTVTRWGTGALNVDACRVGTSTRTNASAPRAERNGFIKGFVAGTETTTHDHGRWPANAVLSHSATCDGVCSPGCAVAELDRQSGTLKSGRFARSAGDVVRSQWRDHEGREDVQKRGSDACWEPSEGGASRFFPTFRYQAKPSTREKSAGLDDRNTHPTVKPVELMRWLVRLVTPPGGTVLDPFAGSGSTLVAATLEGFNAIGVEAEAEYLPLIEGRVRWAERQVGQPAQLALLGETSCD